MVFLSALLALAAAAPGAAPGMPNPQLRAADLPDGVALAGIVTDATLSAAGQEFYRSFCTYWHDKPRNDHYAIAVRERLSARRGNQIVVEYAGRVVFQDVLPPARGLVQPLGEQAADAAYETIVNAELERLLSGGDELAPDEL